MTVATSTIRPGSTANLGGEIEFSDANRTASAIIERWQSGESPDAAAAMRDYPHLRHYKSVVLDLARQEFRLRLQAGEELDAETFSQRFPSLRRSLFFLIGAENFISQDHSFQALAGLVPWPEAGDHFLQFQLISEIGRGAFGRVFLATEASVGNRHIVVKVAPQGGQEAEILGKLRHPNIVPVYSLQEDDATGLTALCMPYLGRATLCDILDHAFTQSRPPSQARAVLQAVESVADSSDGSDSLRPDTFCRKACYVDGIVHVGIQLADALAYAHSRGIYHRDLKPSNVLVTSEGRPLLLDFNLSLDGRLLAGKVGGTVPYMAPEELATLFGNAPTVRQRQYDPRSDVFSLGVILYELMTGTLPFGEISWNQSVEELASQLHQRQKNGPDPIRNRNAQVDQRLARQIESCLAFDPEDRPETAAKLASELRKELSLPRRTTRWIGNHRPFVSGMAALTFACVAAILLFFAFRPPYSVRELRSGLSYNEQGEYALAAGCLDNSIRANPTSSEALFARGIAHQRLGEFESAIQDYNSAHRLTARPFFKACEGYCCNRINLHKAAITAYQMALDEGYHLPAVLNNNIGVSYRMLRKIDESERYLQLAVQQDDRLQAIHYNIAMTALQRSLRQKTPIPNKVFVHVAKVMDIGPTTAELCHDLAALYATAADHDASLIRPAVEYIGEAIELGYSPESFVSDAKFAGLQQDPGFRNVVERTSSTSDTSERREVIQLIDPLDKM